MVAVRPAPQRDLTELRGASGSERAAHERNVGKAAARLEQIAPNEHRLIAGCDGAQPRTPIHEPFDDAQQWMRRVDGDIETSPALRGSVEPIEDERNCTFGQSRIGVKK